MVVTRQHLRSDRSRPDISNLTVDDHPTRADVTETPDIDVPDGHHLVLDVLRIDHPVVVNLDAGALGGISRVSRD